MTNDPITPRRDDPRDEMPLRLIFMIVIAMMISVAQSILLLIAVIQYVILLTNNREPNLRLAEFGAAVGAWVATAARYQSVASDDKPWPWRDLD